MTKKRIIIIGGGIIGTAIAYKLSQKKNEYEVKLFEKERGLALHQSGNNSGVLHCGLYYSPGSLKAKLAVEGIRKMTQFAKEHEIPYDICGKVVLATNDEEAKTLMKLAKNGEKNGLQGLHFLNDSELKKREPFVRGTKALLVPEEGIINYREATKKMAQLFQSNGGELKLGSRFCGVEKINGTTVAKFENGDVAEFDVVVNCTGLHTDRTFKKISGDKSPIKIVPFRGEYLKFKPEYENTISHLVYPVPNVKYPFLGVHFTRMINGEREIGPNAVLALKREGYSNRNVSITDLTDSLTYIGLCNFIRKNFSFSIKEFASSLSVNTFVNKAKAMMPELTIDMLEKGNSGVRAQAMDTKGELIMDFKIVKNENQVHLLNAPSPGATASLSIADYLISNYIIPSTST